MGPAGGVTCYDSSCGFASSLGNSTCFSEQCFVPPTLPRKINSFLNIVCVVSSDRFYSYNPSDAVPDPHDPLVIQYLWYFGYTGAAWLTQLPTVQQIHVACLILLYQEQLVCFENLCQLSGLDPPPYLPANIACFVASSFVSFESVLGIDSWFMSTSGLVPYPPNGTCNQERRQRSLQQLLMKIS